ncbi:MAG TPA: glycoside hydrolase family 3 N-terminal domain-containing protein [Kribbella sp.]|uniref:beta-glucosidase n=1 Tax=Kribbella sp. TaxID=1871183 RepID=UPI002D7A39C7|nr:glycoside hydrolase family 3 N-terminal domain-containing protein [Kribbella sp.]HET6299784.1 glycoside hydrolase family 3 N-terminal domain-containing protein [Kribbella sp.]
MATTVPTPADRPWQNSALPAEKRAELLLQAMTLEEKVAQLGSRWVGNDMADTEVPAEESLNVAPLQDVFANSGATSLQEASRHGLGHLTRVWGSAPLTVEEGLAELMRQHQVVLEGSRLGVPALVHEECLTGFTTYGATVYPAAIAWGATFDPDLIERMAAAIGRDMAAVGVHQGLSPVLDVVRDYRWGRVEETIGEDPYLVAMLGSAYVRGLQSAGVIATLKHFAGYSASRAARNHGPVSMGRRELLDVILPTFETAIATASAGSVMSAYSDIDGVPAGADPWLFTEVLREAWGFTGTVVSDYWAVPFLASMHHVAADPDEAGALALTAGTDVELPDALGFGAGLIERVKSGQLSEDLIDRAARRLLLQKVQLGLLDPDWTPEGSVRSGGVELDSAANRALARELAERSVILLDAGSALPLLGEDRPVLRRVAVVGPCAGDPKTFMGCYAFPNHVLPRYPDRGLGIEVQNAFEALQQELGSAELVYQQGCAVQGDDRSGFEAAVEAARGADLCVAYVGDLAGLFGHGSSGEGCDAEDLRLPGVQSSLLNELLDTGTPVVVVVVSGRPYALGDFVDRAAGLVQAFMPGEEGGAAIAGVLSGRLVPSGKLPVQIPRHPGGQPNTYLQPALGSVESAGISDLDAAPLFAFGFGGSYTRFEVDNLRLSGTEVPTDGEFNVVVRVRNVGSRPGDEVVQLYLHDLLARVARPLKLLTGFVRVSLEPGAGVDVTFRVHADRTSYTSTDLRRIVEPGDLEVLVGTSSADLPCRGLVQLTGPVREVGHDRTMVTPVDLTPIAGETSTPGGAA